MRLNGFVLLTLTAFGAAMTTGAFPTPLVAQGTPALRGVVTSPQEGRMEGVVVNARSNMTERLTRLDPKTGELVEYLIPTDFDTKKIGHDPTTRNPVLWMATRATPSSRKWNRWTEYR